MKDFQWDGGSAQPSCCSLGHPHPVPDTGPRETSLAGAAHALCWLQRELRPQGRSTGVPPSPRAFELPDSEFPFLRLEERREGRAWALFLTMCASLPRGCGLNPFFQKNKPIKDLSDHLHSAADERDSCAHSLQQIQSLGRTNVRRAHLCVQTSHCKTVRSLPPEMNQSLFLSFFLGKTKTKPTDLSLLGSGFLAVQRSTSARGLL